MQRIDRSGCILIAPLKSPFFAHGRVVMVSPRVYPTIHSFANAEHGRVVSSQGLFGRTEGIPNQEGCRTCKGKGGIECKGCKGSGRNKKNGNMFERWKCYDCQGFGLVKCPQCGKRGLTPEQRGER